MSGLQTLGSTSKTSEISAAISSVDFDPNRSQMKAPTALRLKYLFSRVSSIATPSPSGQAIACSAGRIVHAVKSRAETARHQINRVGRGAMRPSPSDQENVPSVMSALGVPAGKLASRFALLLLESVTSSRVPMVTSLGA